MSKQSAQGISLGMKTGLVAVLCLSALVPAYAQSAAASTAVQPNETSTLKFDVASVRENKLGLPPNGEQPSSNVPLGPGNVYSPSGGLLTAKNFTLMTYIAFAYKMTDIQLAAFEKMAPDWVNTDRFDIQARTEKQDVTKDQLRWMVRSLLEERFNFSAHYQTKQQNVYGLQLVKSGQTGPKLQPHPAGSPCPSTLPGKAPDSGPPPSETVAGGFPVTCGGILLLPSSAAGRVNIGARDIPVTLLANSLTGWGQLDYPVKDETSLNGKFDFALEYVPERRGSPGIGVTQPPDAEVGGPTFREALKEQLGLKLEPEKGEVQLVVLDHIDHLSAN